MNSRKVLWPTEAAEQLGVPTAVVVRAMRERRVERVRMADGTLGIPADTLGRIVVPAERTVSK